MKVVAVADTVGDPSILFVVAVLRSLIAANLAIAINGILLDFVVAACIAAFHVSAPVRVR